LLEWCLLRIDLYRENPFAKVPLVITTYEEYDPEEHELEDFKKGATMNPNYFKSSTATDGQIAAKHEIELGITQGVPFREGDKETVTQTYVKSFFTTPSGNNNEELVNEEHVDELTTDAPISTSDGGQETGRSYVRSLLSNKSQQKADMDHLE